MHYIICMFCHCSEILLAVALLMELYGRFIVMRKLFRDRPDRKGWNGVAYSAYISFFITK